MLTKSVTEIVFRVAKARACKTAPQEAARKEHRSEWNKSYRNWRFEMLQEKFSAFDPALIRDKDVLDFGCGPGELSFYNGAKFGAKSCIGLDADDRVIMQAQQTVRDEHVRFAVSKDDQIELADASIDVIVCFDVMEHIMSYEAIMAEWTRVLRPGGKVLIHWQPWFHPYGHHPQDYIPIPWVHAFTSRSQQMEVCARICQSAGVRSAMVGFRCRGKPRQSLPCQDCSGPRQQTGIPGTD